MGSACTKSNAEGIIDDEGAVGLEDEKDINKDEKNVVGQLDSKKKGNSIFYCKENANKSITKKQCCN